MPLDPDDDDDLQALARQAQRLEVAYSLIQALQNELALDRVLDGMAESFVDTAGFTAARIVIDTRIENLHLHHESNFGFPADATYVRTTPVFIRGMEIGTITTWSPSQQALEEHSELLEFVLPTLFMGIDHAVSFAEVLDYRATLEQRVEQRTAELAEANAQLTKTYAELRDAKAARDRFFANINHEIRTPLTLIQLAVEHISRSGEGLSPGSREQLEDIGAGTRRLLHLVNSLLLLAAGDEGKLRITPRNLDIARSISRLVRGWSTAAERGGITLAYAGPTDSAACVDETALETIVGNFVSNAVKFTPREGRITVSLDASADTLAIEVRDTGPGIDPELAPRLFGRFERAKTAAEGGVRGSGIGLSLTKELVDAQGGSIEVITHGDPTGTSFVVRVPRYQRTLSLLPADEPRDTVIEAAPAPPAEKPSAQAHDVQASESTILLAEDDPALQRHVAGILSEHYRVIVASNGRQALELAREHSPDMLVTDLEMPEMNGIELTREFLALGGARLSPVLIVSAHGGLGQRLAGFDAGAVDYVVKPFSADELLARIRSQLALRKLALRLHETEKFAALGVMSAGLAHEMRNPANAIVNALGPLYQLLPEAQRKPDAPGAQLYAVVKTASTHMRELCRNILQFSRNETLAKRPEDLRALVHRAKLVLEQPLAGRRLVENIAVDHRVACAGPLIEQILINLLDNAAYAAGEGGTIELTVREDSARVVVEVSDSGPGVPPHLQERIFEPFFTTKPVGEGTGLGLSVSRRIALNHGGDLRVVRSDRGTAFRLELPL